MSINMDKINAALNEAKSSSEGFIDASFETKYWTPNSGINIIRILPPRDGLDVPFHMVKVHFKADRTGGGKVVCRKNISPMEPCPVCDKVKKLFDSGSEENIKLAKEMKAKNTYVFNIVDRANRETEPVVQVWSVSAGKTLDSLGLQLIQLFADYGDISDPQEGRDIIIEKIISGDRTSYKVKVLEIPEYECPNCNKVHIGNPMDKTDLENLKCPDCGKRLIACGAKRPRTPLGIEGYKDKLWDLEADYRILSVQEMEEWMQTTKQERKEISRREWEEKKLSRKKEENLKSSVSSVDLEEEIRNRIANLNLNQKQKEIESF